MLIQIIACCLFVIKPLSEPMITWALTNKYYSQWLVQSQAMSRRFESKHCVHMNRNCTRNILLLLRLIGSTGNHKNIFYIQNAIELRINHIFLTFLLFTALVNCFTTLNRWRHVVMPQRGRHFANVYFKCTFLNVEISHMFHESISRIDNTPTPIKTIIWCRIHGKPLLELMMA